MADSRTSLLTSAFAPVSGGWFTMGTDRGQEDERPPHRVFVDSFELGVYPVTRAEYECFVDATGHEPIVVADLYSYPNPYPYQPYQGNATALPRAVQAAHTSLGVSRATHS